MSLIGGMTYCDDGIGLISIFSLILTLECRQCSKSVVLTPIICAFQLLDPVGKLLKVCSFV